MTCYDLLINLVSALPASQYSSTTTTQSALISLHLALERQRILARRHLATRNGSNGSSEANVTRGPRIMVLGPPSSGKTAVVKNLVNMALGSGMGWNMGVIGLDPSSVSYTTLSAGHYWVKGADEYSHQI